MKKTIGMMMLAFLCACSSQTETEKHHRSRSKVVKVKDRVKEIDTGNDVLIGRSARALYSEDYLVIQDYDAWEGAIHLFDRGDFHYITSAGSKGQGPDELTNIGDVLVDEARRKFYITDNAKYKVFSYDMDSIVSMGRSYRHQLKAKFTTSRIPSHTIYINDTLSYCRLIVPTSVSTFDQMIGKWNMLTGEIKVIGEKHPDTHQKRTMIDVSMEKSMMVEASYQYDLMNISDLDGNIQCYIYGPDWETKGLRTFGDVMITPNHILASYSGDEWAKGDTYKIHVFDLKGNYQQTLDVGYKMRQCTYDKTHHRLFMVFNDEIQFGYLDLKGIL